MRFSANLGFLWKDRPFLQRIAAAREAGFDAVEFHDHAQREDPAALIEAVRTENLPVCGLNVRHGATNGCAAIPGETVQARADIDTAIATADLVDAGGIHILSGRTAAPDARATLIDNLFYALDRTCRTILIEPICRASIPDYFLHDLDQARSIVEEIDHPNLRLLFDVFHIAMEHGHVEARFAAVADFVGHVQIASVPRRNEPNGGELDILPLLNSMRALGYTGQFGCEFMPRSAEAPSFGFLREWRAM